MPSFDADAERIISTLERHQVDYVVIGGFAAELWGVAVPPTRDIDITPDSSRDNLGRPCHALNELRARIRVTGSDPVEIRGG